MNEATGTRKAVYTVIDPTERNPKARWVRIGIAFVNRDGSLTCLLDAHPVNGRLQIRDFPTSEGDEATTPRPAEQPAESASRKARQTAPAAA